MALNGLDGKVAIVTGGARGIGAAVAARLCDEGARVAVVDLDGSAADRVVASLPDGAAVAVEADVTSEAGVDHYVGRALEVFGRIDLFHNNAGIEGRLAPIVDLDAEEFEAVMAVNVRGVFLGLRAVLRQLSAQGTGGAIVNTSSVAGLSGAVAMAPYVTSKHAVIGLTRCAAVEGGPLGVRVNGVLPGATATDMLDRIERGMGVAPDIVRSRFEAMTPLGRYAEASEVAAVVAWLLSDEASYVSGGMYTVDGALSAS